MPEGEKYRIGIVDVSEAAEQAARDTAEARLTASREQLRGARGFFSRIWQHNLFHEYYRQREIARANAQIQQQQNLYAGEGADRVAHEHAMGAVVDRFTHEYDHYESELIHRGEVKEKIGEREEERGLKDEIMRVVREYASGALDDEHFEEQKNRLLMERLRQQKPELFERSQFFAENLKEIALQVKQAVEHGGSLDELTNNVDIILGQARAGVRTEAHLNTVDRVVEKLKQTRIGKYINETTAASVVAIAGSVAKSLTTGIASRVLSWATFGGSAMVGSGVAAARESVRLEEERRLHARERAMGKEIAPGSRRREQMEQFRYQTKEANQLADELDSLVYGPETRELKSFDANSVQQAMAKLAEIEARNRLSDEHNIDLISFSSPTEIEQERLRLDLARAEAKVQLRSYLAFHPDVHLPDEAEFDAHLDRLTQLQIRELTESDEGIDQRNRLFTKMKRAGVAKAAIKGLAAGLVVGEIVHETKGLITGEMTPLRWLTQWWKGELPRFDLSKAHEQIINDLGSKVKLPESIKLTPNPDGSFGLVDEQSGRVFADRLTVNPDGTFTDESKQLLEQQGIRLSEKTDEIVEVVTREKTVGAKQYVQDHLDDMQRVRRTLWFDNDTPMYRDPRTGKLLGADFNELKLWWGGKGGLDASGNYVFNVSHMTPSGSFHKGLSVDAQELIKEGKLKILLSLSRDTQKYVFEVPIDLQGNAVIPKDGDIGKLLFNVENGRAVFNGQFAEVALSAGEKDGIEHVKLLATHVGEGIKTTTEQVPETITKKIPETLLDVPAEYHVEPPPIIPLFGRWPLEMLRARGKRGEVEYYGYGGENIGLLDRSKYKERMAEGIKNNPDFDVASHDSELVKDYIDKLPDDYQEELKALDTQISQPMDRETKVVIGIPAYQEEKNIAKTLEAYAKQKNPKEFEVIVFENHPDTKARDKTAEAVRRFQSAHPALKVHLIYKIFPKEQAKIGNIRKYLNDLILRRKQAANHTEPIVMVSNDADLEDASEEYVGEIIKAFDRHKTMDAASGKWDYPKEAFRKMPLFQAAQRLWHFFDIVFRHKYLRSPELIGRNSMFRSGIYAAVGGYNPEAKLAEDLEIGWLVKDARNYNPERIGYVNTASIVSNPRRSIVKMMEGVPNIEQYGDFHENGRIREYNWQKLLEEKLGKVGKDRLDFTPEELSKEINAVYRFYNRLTMRKGGWVPDKMFGYVFRRAMGFLGVKYKVENERVIMEDTTKLERGLAKS